MESLFEKSADDRRRRGPRARERREATCAAVLRAAGRLFRERGFAQTAMRDIAEAAGLSTANLYYYFAGKDQILFFCQDRSLDLMLAGVRDGRGRAGAAERLTHVLREHVRAMLDEVGGAGAHLATDALPPALRRRIVAKRDRYERGVRALVAAGMAGGEFARGDAAVLTRAMLGAVNWTATWFRAEGPRSAAEVAGAIADYLVNGLRAGAPASRSNRDVRHDRISRPGPRARAASGERGRDGRRVRAV